MFNFLRLIFLRLIGAGTSEPPSSSSAALDGQSTPISVSYDATGVSLLLKDQLVQQIAWSEIELIAIRIEDDFLPFPYWYVGNKSTLLRIPNDATGGRELFFDGFGKYISGYTCDEAFKVIIEASAAMEGSFIVWKTESVETNP